MIKLLMFCVAVFAVAQNALAQFVTPPGAGGQFQQIPPTPVPQRPFPEIRIEQPNLPAVPLADQVKIPVRSLSVSGQSVYSEAELITVTGFSPGGELTLGELRAMAAKIADFYRRNGYFVAQAYLPAQDIKDGAVKIAVLEGRYGTITLRNESRLKDSVANGLLDGLNSGDLILIGPLETRLLLLSDIPGVVVRSTMVPGTNVGTSDLIVDVTPGRPVSGSVEADNAGSRYTGEYRVGATININNPLGLGDQASVRVLTSGSGLTYGRASYQMPFGRATVGVAYTALQYELGKEFAPLRAHGTAEILSVYGSYPLIRSRDTNLYATLGFDAKTFQDRVDSTSTVTDKDARLWIAGLHGNHNDRFLGGGVNTYSVTGTFGDIDIRTPAALTADQAGARTNGNFGKLGFHAARLQRVTDVVSLHGSIYGQVASKNLDISEKIGLGGMYAVRAYPVGETYADEGYVASLDVRYLLPKFSDNLPGRVSLLAFVDTGSVTINKNPFTTAPNSRTLSGMGVGATWADYNNFVVNAYYAWKLGDDVATSAPDKNGRFWIQAVKYF